MRSSEPSVPDYSLYTADYHDSKADRSRHAADLVLPIVFAVVDVTSVLDVGCGYGSWLAAARALGVTDLTGIEGPWAAAWRDRDVLADEFDLVLHDLERPLPLGRTFDLVICVEVAEHLTEARGPSFVADLCAAAGAVLFGAAVPGQLGPNHVNERWASDWAAEFAHHSYQALDVVRPRVWGETSMPVYYRQNPLLFVSDADSAAVDRAAALPPPGDAALDLVHPEARHGWGRTQSEITLREHLRLLPRIPGAARRSLVRRLRAGRRSGD